jgi:hypothetical protein
MTYGQRRLVSNIGPGQSSALRPISIQTLTEIKLKKILNIDKYFVCESRSDESGIYIYAILLKLKTILFTWRYWPKYTYFKMSK